MSTNQTRPLALTLSALLLALLCAVLLGPTVAQAGTVTIVDGTDAPSAGTYTDGWIQDHLNITGSLTISTTGIITGPDNILVQAGVEITWTTGFSLTLLAENDIVISGTLKHDGPESGEGGLRLLAARTAMVGTGAQTSGVAAGSRHGLTRVDAVDLVLKGGSSNSGGDPYAMLGFRAVNEAAAFTVTGPISVTVSQHVTASGGSADFAFVQIGHGGADASQDSTVDGNFVGPVAIVAGGDVTFHGSIGNFSSAQLGNGGFLAIGDHSGGHTLHASGDITFQGGTAVHAYAQLGNGGNQTTGDFSSGHTLQTSGDVTFRGGGDFSAYAQLGNGGRGANGNHSGGHTLYASGYVTFQGGTGNVSTAQMGNGGFGAVGNHSGGHTLHASGDVTIQGGTWDHASAQLGNGGIYADGEHSGSLILTTTAGLTVTAGSDVNTYAMLGHGSDASSSGENGSGSRSGNISVSVGATAVFTDAHIGHLTKSGILSVNQGNTLVGVSQNDPSTGTGRLIATGAVRFTSAPTANNGQLRLYIPRDDSQRIPTTTTFNGESFAIANIIPEDHIRGFYLFGDGPYAPNYSFYLKTPDAVIGKTVSPTSLLRPGDPLTYTLSFSNTGAVTATGVIINDTLPDVLSDVNVTNALDAGVVVTQTSDSPNLAWQVSDLGAGQGGRITITATLSDSLDLLGKTITNTVSIAATGDVTLTNNTASAGSSIVAAGTMSGTVVDSSGAGIEGAQVTLSDENGALSAAFLRTESTDADGTYVFDAVPTGTYTLTVEAEGYQPSDPVAVTVIEDETTAAETIVLQEASETLYLPAVSANSTTVASAARVEETRRLFLPTVVR